MDINRLVNGLEALVSENSGKKLSPEDAAIIESAAMLARKLRARNKIEGAFHRSVKMDESISFAPGSGCPCCGR